MMRCNDISYYTPLYLSSELDSKTLADIERHLATCASCRMIINQQRELDNAIQSAVLTEPFETTDLLRKVDHAMTESCVSPRRSTWSSRWPHRWQFALPAMVALLLLVCIGLSNHQLGTLYAAAGIDHTDDIIRAIPKPGWEMTSAGIQSYLSDRIGDATAMARLQIPGYQFLKARDCHLDGKTYTHIVYTDGKDELSLYIRPRSASLLYRLASSLWMPGVHSRPEEGLSVARANTSGYSLFLVGQVEQSKARNLIQHAVNAL
jgi:anti-sigma factor RsiW